VVGVEAITDLYITGARLRLREARPLDGGPVMRRLTRKADLSPDRRLITSIYLSEAEFALFRDLPGARLLKRRHTFADGLTADRFEGALDGLVLAEREFETDAEMAAFPQPAFAVREVTADPRYTGGALAIGGRP
jgi:CYTH domain-containing protein